MEQEIDCKIDLREVDAEFVNPFLRASFDVLAALGNKPTQKGKLTLHRLTSIKHDASILFRINGSVRGVVVFGMKEDTALNFASSFLMGIPVEHLDDMAVSSLEEFALRVTEKAKSRLIRQGMLANVTYSFYSKKDLKFAEGTQFLHVPFITTYGPIQIFMNLSSSKGN